MVKYNLNNNIVIYPNENGWNKIIEIVKNDYNLTWSAANEWVERRKTEDNGFKELLWVIISDFHNLFFNGSIYLDKMEIKLIDEVQIDIKELRKLKIKNLEK